MGSNHNDPSKFKGKYRIASARCQGWDYAGAGTYFVTICTEGRVRWFGEIANGVMRLSNIGRIIDECWHEIPQHYSHATLDEWIVMPDHMHGILIMHQPQSTKIVPCNPHHHREWQSGSLGSIIQQFKRACTKRIREIGHPNFEWQPRFHDRIIGNAYALACVRSYVRKNPGYWKSDQ